MAAYQTFRRLVEKIIYYTAAAGMIFVVPLMLLTTGDVIGRSFFNKPVAGTFELYEYMLAGIILFSAAYTQQVKGHVSVDFLTARFGQKTRGYLRILTTGLSLVIVAIIFWQGIRLGLEETAVTDQLRIQLLEVIGALLHGRRPRLPASSVCIECKRRGTPCVLVTRRAPCLGPITHDGCGALCPGFQRGCYGCFGPMESPNVAALSTRLCDDGVSRAEIGRLLRTFNVGAEPFRAGAAHLDVAGAGPGRAEEGR